MDHCIKMLQHHEKFSQNQKRKVLQGDDKQYLLEFTGYTHSEFCNFAVFQLPNTNEAKCNRKALTAIKR